MTRAARKTSFAAVFTAALVGLLIQEGGHADTAGTALQFNGSNQYVTFGAAPGLGAATFTLETWFKRTGAGVAIGTGGGGITSAIPLVTKGRGEADGSNVDMNYFLGIDSSTNRLAADFEDMATGLNHPVYGSTLITSNVWHHAAVTYDGQTWKLYLDGSLDGTLTLSSPFVPRSDSIQHAALATALNSTGAAAGFLAGVLDETRIWNVARTQAEIQATKNSEIPTPTTGLIGRWGMNEGSGTVVTNSAGSTTGAAVNGPVWVAGFPLPDTIPPAPPQNLTATAGNALITLTWSANTETDLDGYNVYRGTAPGGEGGTPLNGGTLVTGTTFTDYTATNGTPYYYVVTAVDSGANASTASNEATASPDPAAGAALFFDGTNDYVTFGPAPGLGTATFTLETWFKRTGAGVAVGTGSGGITSAIPLVTKGRGEGDGSNVDMNYFLGIDASTNRLAADFEDTATGLNHPIYGSTVLTSNVWHHAAATYDGSKWQLFLDGSLDAQLVVGATPRSDSIQHAGLATAMTSTGVAAGFYAGILDEVRIWNYARTQSQIQSTMNAEVPTAAGLLGRWGMNEGSGTVVGDSSGAAINGTLMNGPLWVASRSFGPMVNQAPIAAAGPDQTITLPAQALLNGSVSDDGLPTPPALTVAWSKTSGPGIVSFGNPNSSTTTASFSVAGTYVLRLSADDGELTSYDEATITVYPTGNPSNQAVDFGGTNAYVSFGNPAKLHLSTFTIEAWFNRQGSGVTATTGTGGIASALPLVTRGTGQADDPLLDMNYFLGIDGASNVLAADFEEGAGGPNPSLNHPVRGVTPVTNNIWHHAAATYDGSKWQLFLDGVLESELVVGRPVAAAGNQWAAVGSALTSGGAAASFFDGVIDEARIWDHALTASEIQANINLEITSATGLVARWGLNEGSGTLVGDSIGTPANGTIMGTNWSWALGAPFTINHPPGAPVLIAPANGGTGVTTPPSLDVAVSDLDGGNLTVTYYGRPRSNSAAGSDFALVALPDAQNYVSSVNGGSPAIFNAQTQWVADNTASRNIVFVTQLGDAVQNGDNGGNPVEWIYADAAMSKLDVPAIPFGVAVGNHDQSPNGDPNGTTTFYNQYFGESRFTGRTYYGGHYGTNNDNHFDLFTAGGLDFIVVYLEYDPSANPAVLAWANGLLQTYNNRRAIVVSHSVINSGNPGSFSAQGQAIYNALKGNSNFFLMLCGHVPGEGQRRDTYNGQTVTTLLSDYQSRSHGGDGWLRILEFSPANNQIRVKTYSPTLNQYETDADSQFTIDYNMEGNTAPWTAIGTNPDVPSGSTTSATWSGLAPNTEYEWYVTVSDGERTTTGPIWRFGTTAIMDPTTTFTGAPANSPYGSSFTVASTTNSSASPAYTSSGACSNVGTLYTMTSGTGTCTSTVTWAADANYNAATRSQTTAAVPAVVTVLLGNLTQSFDGTPRAVTVTTIPPGLAVDVTYEGSSTPPTAVGSYAVFATVVDPNYQGSASDTLVIRDTTAPDTVIDSGPVSPTSATAAGFVFHSTEAGSTFQCRLDAGPFAPCASPANYDALSEGNHTFQVVATDPAGNADASPAMFAWTIDTTAPSTLIDSMPSTPTNQMTALFAFHASEIDSMLECRLDSSSPTDFVSCSSPSVYSAMSEGSHTFEVRAKDPAGNVGGPAAFTWVVDLTAPDTIIDTAPQPMTNSNTATFTFHASEGGAFACQLDGGVFIACTSPVVYSGVPEGPHTFRVKETDTAGNIGNVAVFNWTIDTTPPETSITAGPDEGSSISSTSVTFQFDAADNVTLPTNLSFECRLDSTDPAAFAACTSPASYGMLSGGGHSFDVRARDQAGNTDFSPATRSWTVDIQAPDTMIDTAPPVVAGSGSATFTFHSTEAGSTFQCKLDSGALEPCVSPAAYTGLAEGGHTFEVAATDTAGNADATPATFTWSIDRTPPPAPAITSHPPSLTNETSASFGFVDLEGGVSFGCSLDGEAPAACASPVSYAGPLSAGSHTFAVLAIDAAGNASPAASFGWTIDTTPPDTAIDAGPVSPTNSTTAGFSFHSTEGGSTFACKLDSAAPAPCTSPATYTGLNEGSHTFQVQATDGASNADATPAAFSWSIDTTAPSTLIDSMPANPTRQATATFAFHASEPPSTLECRLDSTNPTDFVSCTSPNTYTGLLEGGHTFEVRAKDQAGNLGTVASFTWALDLTAPDATIDTRPPLSTNSNTATFAFHGSEEGSFSCRLDDGEFSACTSPQTYPGLGDGTHTFQVHETDAAGNPGLPVSYSWIVDTTPPASSITFPVDGTGYNAAGWTGAVTGTASDQPGGSGLASVEISIRRNTDSLYWNGTSFASETEIFIPVTGTTAWTYGLSADILTDAASYQVRSRAGDNAGNLQPTPTGVTFTFAKLNPTVTFTGAPPIAPYQATLTVVSTTDSSASPVYTSSGACSNVGTLYTMISGTGTCVATVTWEADANYYGATKTQTTTAAKINQAALTLAGVPLTAAYQSHFTVTPGGGNGSSSLVVSTSGVCSNAGNDVTMTSGTGTCTVKVNRAGDSNYNDATEVTASASATKINQAALTLAGVPPTAAYQSHFTVTPGGGSSSSSPVVSTSGVCSNAGNDVTMTSGTGTCTVKVNRSADSNYNDATEVTASAAATKINPTVSLTAPPTAAFGSTFTPDARTNASTAAAITVDAGSAGVCSILGTTVTMISGSGNCALTAKWASDTNYNPGVAHSLTTATLASTVANVSVSPGPSQYSDRVTLTATLSPGSLGGQIPATTVTFLIGTQNMGSADLVASGNILTATRTVSLLEPTPFGTSPTGQMAPGDHTVTAVFGGVNPNFSVGNPTTRLTIAEEDAHVTYSGLYFFSTGSATASSVNVTMQATVQDATAFDSADPNAGDIRNARVSFVNRDRDSTPYANCANLAPVLVDPTDPKTGVVSCTTRLDIGSSDSQEFTVGLVVDNYYIRNSSSDDAVLTVSNQLTAFVVGAGNIVNQASAGQYAGTNGALTSFGLHVKNNKSGRNLQGGLNVIVRRLENGTWKTYQIKSNQTNSIVEKITSPLTGTAQFTGKANLTDITDPLNPISLGGNLTFQVTLTDDGEAAANDSIGLTLWNGSTLYYSTSWNGVKTIEQGLNAGQIQVR